MAAGAACRPDGLGLLRAMSHDLLGTLAGWQRAYGDVVHVRVWPEHAVVVTDPALVRELLVTHHDALGRWERAVRVFAQVHGHSVLIAEGDAWATSGRRCSRISCRRRCRRSCRRSRRRPDMRCAVARARSGLADRKRADVAGDGRDHAHDVLRRDRRRRTRGRGSRAGGERGGQRRFLLAREHAGLVPWKRGKARAMAVLNGLIDRQLHARLDLPARAWPDDLLSRLLRLHRATRGAGRCRPCTTNA